MEKTLAFVPTAHASRYLQQLAKHWSHKFAVEFTPQNAVIELPLGRCALAASPERLEVVLSGEGDLARFKDVVAEHLQRFGHRETLVFDWR